MKCCLVYFMFGLMTESWAHGGNLVSPRKFTVLALPGGGDWNTARATCHAVNMTLATVDLHAFSFLVSQSFLRQFQRYAYKPFWIGLYDENTRNHTSADGNYRWETDCETALQSAMFWEEGEPSNTAEAFCVFADNVTLRWRTDQCSARHHFLCQRKNEACHYNRTLPTCTLYITASLRLTLPYGTPDECSVLCDNTLKDHLPCWGFTMTSEGCVLHFQSTQPHCVVYHHRSTAFFRTCFQMFYADGPLNDTPSNKSLPIVPQCLRPSEFSTAASSQSPKVTSDPEIRPPDDDETSISDLRELVTTTSKPPSSSSSPITDNISVAATTASKNQLTSQASNTSPPTIKPFSSKLNHGAPSLSPRCCTCRREVTRRNKTVVLKDAEVTKQRLKVDVTTLSSTRRRKHSASDDRVSSRGIAYIGIGFVAVFAACVILPDVVTLVYHVLYGVPAKGKRAKKRVCQSH